MRSDTRSCPRRGGWDASAESSCRDTSRLPYVRYETRRVSGKLRRWRLDSYARSLRSLDLTALLPDRPGRHYMTILSLDCVRDDISQYGSRDYEVVSCFIPDAQALHRGPAFPPTRRDFLSAVGWPAAGERGDRCVHSTSFIMPLSRPIAPSSRPHMTFSLYQVVIFPASDARPIARGLGEYSRADIAALLHMHYRRFSRGCRCTFN